MSFIRSTRSPKPSSFLRAVALVVAAGCLGAVACSDEAPVNPPQGTPGKAGAAGTDADNGTSGTDNDGSGKGGSDTTPEGGSGDGGDSAVPAAGTAGSAQGGAGGMSGNDGKGGFGGSAGLSGGGGNGGAGASNGGNAGHAGTSAGNGGGGAGGTTAGTGGTSAGTDAGGNAGTAGTGNSGTCGDGTVNGTEECEEPGTAVCSNDCQSVATQACADCEATQSCAVLATACTTSSGTQTPADQAKCFAVEECIMDTGCAKGGKTITSCFCGDLLQGDCTAAPETGPNAPHGACAAVMKSAAGTGVTNTKVLTNMGVRSNPLGAAASRFNCLWNSDCKATCGFE